MSFMGIGPIELVVVLVIAYLVLGPERMTSTVRSLAKVVRDLKEQTSGIPKTLDDLLQSPDEEDKEPEAPGIARPRRARTSQAPDDVEDVEDPKAKE